jgi:RNA-directed DNA polymerase
LGHGTGDLKFFIIKYHKTVRGFGHSPLGYPVIVLFDNDDGGRELFGFARAHGAPTIDFSSTDPFYYLGLNLYLVKTPEKLAPHKSCIEDLFDPALQKTVLDGKTFDPDKEHNAPGKYGKIAFAEQVVVRRSRLFGQLPGRNRLKIGSRLLVSPLPEIKFIPCCCGVL